MATSPASGPGGAAFDGGTVTQPIVVDDGSGDTATLAVTGLTAADATRTTTVRPSGLSAQNAVSGASTQATLSTDLGTGLSVIGAGASTASLTAGLRGMVLGMISAPASGDLAPEECALWFDPTNGAAKLMVKAKTSDGTVVTAAIALA